MTTSDTSGIVLAGGRSSRMGEPKAALEWHGSTLLRRSTGLLARTVDGPVVVVRAPGQPLPPLPHAIEVVDDPVEGLGPVQGIATGLAAVADRTDTAFICSTDLPFLHPAYVCRVLGLLAEDADFDVVLPHVGGHRQPLATAYRVALGPVLADMTRARALRLGELFERCRTRHVEAAELLADDRLRELDPELDSVLNVNEPAEYRAARNRLAPGITVERSGALATDERRGPATVYAATLGAAAVAVALPLGQRVAATLNGNRITTDPALPLVTGDTVTFRPADTGD